METPIRTYRRAHHMETRTLSFLSYSAVIVTVPVYLVTSFINDSDETKLI